MADILNIHRREIDRAQGSASVRSYEDIEACSQSPQASFGGDYLNDLFEMAVSYIVCLTIRHPFTDGNKRTALASSLVFLYMNGYMIMENEKYELADLILSFLNKTSKKEDLVSFFSTRSVPLN